MAQLALTKHQPQTRPYRFHPLGEHSRLTLTHPLPRHTEPPRILTLISAESLIANRICSHKGLNNCHVLCMIVADTKSCRDASSLLKTHLLQMLSIQIDLDLCYKLCRSLNIDNEVSCTRLSLYACTQDVSCD